MKNIRLIGVFIVIGVILLVPYTAMKLGVEGVNWTALDFVAAGILLLGAGLAIEIALRIFSATRTKAIAVTAVLFGLVMVWGALVHMGG